MPYTPEQFAAKLQATARSVQTEQRRALEARVAVHRKAVLAGAASSGGLGRKVTPRWVGVTYEGGTDNPVARMRLSGGFAILQERGSYKKSGGWDEGPKNVTARRRRNAARKGVSLEQKGGLNTPYGVFAHVHHPQLGAHPFFRPAIDLSKTPAAAAYSNIIQSAIASAIR